MLHPVNHRRGSVSRRVPDARTGLVRIVIVIRRIVAHSADVGRFHIIRPSPRSLSSIVVGVVLGIVSEPTRAVGFIQGGSDKGDEDVAGAHHAEANKGDGAASFEVTLRALGLDEHCS